MLVNPFNLSGPQFLIFYFVAGGLTLLCVRFRFQQQESKWPMPKLNLTDPYEIAFLRGGENEALRIAVLSLIDRGLLVISDDNIKTKNKLAIDHVRRPIEKAILRKFASAGKVHELYGGENIKVACTEYRTSLARHRLIANSSVYEARRPMLWLGLLILGGLAGAKLFLALQRGRHNVTVLIILASFALWYLFKFYNVERTGLGDHVLSDLRNLFKGLNDRGSSIKSGGETNEAALLAAVFGVMSLSTKNFPFIKNIFPKASNSSTTGCGSSCGSSCGGSCGSGGCGGCGGD
ncbi:MAG TPA: TIGR04222 domain-containing membrane protein [Bacteriovoracaceae bacterium]|nr:TIGR04222 domain-containing membrane protein [Bacteriovoracaceae bacterium]